MTRYSNAQAASLSLWKSSSRCFANPAFYGLAGSAAYRDVISPKQLTGAVRADYINSESGAVRYTIRLMNQMLSLTVAKGYDDGTGLGSPNGGAFVSALSN